MAAVGRSSWALSVERARIKNKNIYFFIYMRTAWIRNETVDAFTRAIRAGTIDYNILRTYDFQ